MDGGLTLQEANATGTSTNYSIFVVVDPNNSSLFVNDSKNISGPVVHEPTYDSPVMIVICVILGTMILATILGNVFVISAIFLEKSLQGVSNYLILSLAITDLFVAVFVMPISLIDELSIHWFLGSALCDFWISMDILCCTASILHLVAIAFDRFWGVSNIDYIRRRCAKQILVMVVIVWVVSVSISIPPLVGWRDNLNDPSVSGMCLISQDFGYTIFSTVGAFYCPLILMLVLNYKIYIAARSRIHKKRFVVKTNPTPTVAITITENNAQTRHSSGSEISQDGFTVFNGTCVNDNDNSSMEKSQRPASQISTGLHLGVPHKGHPANRMSNNNVSNVSNVTKLRAKEKDKEKRSKEKTAMRRERKAAKVLGIITGAFVVCWLPFFIIALTAPFCGDNCTFPPPVISSALWLGYCNSLLNPILYTIFNPSFRNAFQKIFCRKMYRDMRRPR